MTISRDLYIFFAAAVLLTSKFLLAQDGATALLEPKQIRTGQTAELKITLPKAKTELSPADLRREIQVVDDLLLKGKDYRVLDRIYNVVDGSPTWTYKITAYKPGGLVIPPIEFVWGASTYSTERMEFEVVQTRADSDNDVRKGFPAIDMPFRFPWWIWKPFLLAMLSLLAVFLAFKYLPRFIRSRVRSVPSSPSIIEASEDPLDWLKRHLDALRHKLETDNYDERIVDELTFIIKRYFAMKVGGPVESWTTTEFKRRLTYDRKATQLLRLFRECDAYKFMRSETDPLAFTEHNLEEAEKILTQN